MAYGCISVPTRAQRPNLPVIPLPLPPESLDAYALNKFEARQQLGIAADHAVVVWLGRLSLLTKIDPWPTYSVLEKVARKLRRPLVFIECGPDDKPSPHVDLERLRQLCPSVRFLRLGGESLFPRKLNVMRWQLLMLVFLLWITPRRPLAWLWPRPWQQVCQWWFLIGAATEILFVKVSMVI